VTKIEKMRRTLNENFRELLNTAFKKEFNLDLTTTWNFIGMHLESYLTNGEDLNEEQSIWIQTYSAGYRDAMVQVEERAK